ncbi:uncharacterized protein METZ01_LOCUS290937 [marine metagenome]|uniref:Phospholipase D-like domain-containing protein n=1 Tax=marine metagenome TaxID=408172 RepID=A0A382LP02_9ZZZZ
MAVYVRREPWPAITSAVDSANGRVRAAIAYFGTDSHELLPLKEGDTLVCDVSERAVKNGSTNPTALKEFVDEGVDVWSYEGLHAKVVVLPRRAFVGSANASRNSSERLFEAVIETTDTDEIRDLRAFVNDLCVKPIDLKELTRLKPLIPKRPRPSPVARDLLELPENLDRLEVLSLSKYKWSASEVRAWELGDKKARKEAKRRYSGFRVNEVSVDEPLDEGLWVVQVVDGRALSPGVVVYASSYRNAHVVWLARPNEVAKRSFTSTERATHGIPDPATYTLINGPEAQRIVDLFR